MALRIMFPSLNNKVFTSHLAQNISHLVFQFGWHLPVCFLAGYDLFSPKFRYHLSSSLRVNDFTHLYDAVFKHPVRGFQFLDPVPQLYVLRDLHEGKPVPIIDAGTLD